MTTEPGTNIRARHDYFNKNQDEEETTETNKNLNILLMEIQSLEEEKK